LQLQLPPPFEEEPAGQEATHWELLQRLEAQSMPLMQGWPLVARQALPTSCVVGAGHWHVFVAESQTEPDGVAHTHVCDPKPAVVDQDPVGHRVQGGVPLRRSK
jgi:hypothetical protein